MTGIRIDRYRYRKARATKEETTVTADERLDSAERITIPTPRGILETGWYTTEEVAEVLKVDPSSLRRWRTAQPPQGPPFVHLSDRVTRYFGADVLAYLQRNRIDPTAA